MHGFDGQARHALWQFIAFAEHAQANLIHIQGGKLCRVMRQLPGNQLVLVGGMHRQRPHHRQAAALCGEHARDVHKRFGVLRISGQTQLHRHRVFLVQLEAEIKQARLLVANQPRHGDGGAYIA